MEISESVHTVDETSITATHSEVAELRALVAPSSEKQFNTIRVRLIPKACWRLEDTNFEFGSSFVMPSNFHPNPLRDLMSKHKGCRLTIFAHGDPTGKDDFNKTLSGRRAQAIYALLTRRSDLWADLYYDHNAYIGKDEWGVRSVQIMLSHLGFDVGYIDGKTGPVTRLALRDFQGSQSLPQKDPAPDGTVDMVTFRALAESYMDAICVDDKGQQFKLTPEDFLAKGADKAGRGDYQGCGEFNPLLVFSKDEELWFNQTQNRPARDRENQQNRRVMALLFRPEAEMNLQWWPCPAAKEGKAGCLKRFWSDGEERRSNGPERREYEKTKNTFACRFYDRLVSSSPCEAVIPIYEIRLYDQAGKYIPDAPYRVGIGSQQRQGKADKNGWVRIRELPVPNRCILEWGYPYDESNPPVMLPFMLELFLDLSKDEIQEPLQQLNNLGYPISSPPEVNVEAFQKDYGDHFELMVTGVLDPKTRDAIKQVHETTHSELRTTPKR